MERHISARPSIADIHCLSVFHRTMGASESSIRHIFEFAGESLSIVSGDIEDVSP
jgi:hypothetical protein